MAKDDMPMVQPADEEAVTDMHSAEMKSFGRFLAHVVAAPLIPPMSEKAKANQPTLTDEDLRALDSLGTPEAFVKRALSQIEQEASATQSTTDTYRDTASTRTVLKTPRRPNEPSAEFAELAARQRTFQSQQRVTWSCEYKRVKRIGRGGQGVVHLVESDFGEQRALKTLSLEPYEGDALAFYRDMDRMAELATEIPKRHDNLLEVEHFSPRDGFMIMKLIEGFDLDRLMHPKVMSLLKSFVDAERWKFLSNNVFIERQPGCWALMPGVAVMFAEKILRGLSALHEIDVVHGDVKPSNSMVDVYGSIRVIDIGSAVKTSQPLPQPSFTPRYAAPEVLEGEPSTPKSDLASVGYMLIELISGRPALIDPPAGWDSVRTFDPKKRLALANAKRELFNRLHELIPGRDLSCPQLMELFRKLIHPEPQKRFENIDEALKQTDSFRNALVQGGLSLNWCQVFKFWVRDVHAALERLG